MDNIEKIDNKILDFYNDLGSSDIKELYETVPYLSDEQRKIIAMLKFYSDKYMLHDIRRLVDDFVLLQQKNRKSIMFKKMIEALSLYKHFKGLKISGNGSGDED